MKPSEADSAADLPAGMPGQNTRTIVSLLLFVHLFAVGLAIMTSGDFISSDLLRDVKQKPQFIDLYLTQLWLDRGYDYYLMNDFNWDFHLQATVKYADGHADEPFVLPGPNMPNERRQRYQQLANSVAQYIARAANDNVTEDEAQLSASRKPLLPESIGAGLIRQHPGADSVSLQCIYHEGINIAHLHSTDPKENDPFGPQYFTTVGNQSIVLDHGEPTVFENLPVVETSPLRSNKPKSKQPAPSADAPSKSATGEK